MLRYAAVALAILMLVPTAAEAKKSKHHNGDRVCVGGQKYSAKRCGGPKKNIPSYCLNGKHVAGGYLIKNGGCYQNNGGGE